jgi:ribosomal protein L29
MAIKKTTKLAKQATEIKTVEQLRTDVIAAKTNLIESKRGHKLGELTNPRAITVARKKIARLLTAIRAAEILELKEDK